MFEGWNWGCPPSIPLPSPASLPHSRQQWSSDLDWKEASTIILVAIFSCSSCILFIVKFISERLRIVNKIRRWCGKPPLPFGSGPTEMEIEENLEVSEGRNLTKKMEVKHLKLEGTKEMMEQEYGFELDLPSKEDLIELLELQPNYILSTPVDFHLGPLGQIPHALKLMISRDFRDMYLDTVEDLHIGLFLKVEETTKFQEFQISGISGTIENRNGNLPTTSPRILCFHKEEHELRCVCSGLENFDCYKSYCNTWPIGESRVTITLKVGFMEYPSIIEAKPGNLISAEADPTSKDSKPDIRPSSPTSKKRTRTYCTPACRGHMKEGFVSERRNYFANAFSPVESPVGKNSISRILQEEEDKLVLE